MNGACVASANMERSNMSLRQTNIEFDKANKNIENTNGTLASTEFSSDVKNKTSNIGAKHSLSKDVKICQMPTRPGICKINARGSGWGTPIGLGLRGGGETSIQANGASGWGPPPQPNTNVTRGWGQPQATNSPANGTSAWGTSGNPASVPISTGLLCYLLEPYAIKDINLTH